MEIQLTPETEKAVNAAVLAGGYSTAEEYIYEALQNYYKLKLEQLNAAIAIGIEQADRGELIDANDISFENLLREEG